MRSAVKVDAGLLERARKVRVIGRAGIGVDNIDLDAATRQGIAVMNTPGANAVAVAEHTFALALALARHLCRANELLHAGKWEKKTLQGAELRGKMLGIIGLGRIGMEVARRWGARASLADPALLLMAGLRSASRGRAIFLRWAHCDPGAAVRGRPGT